MKQTIYSISGALGVHRTAAAVHRRQPLILAFHGVTSDSSGSHMCMGDSDGDIWTGAM